MCKILHGLVWLKIEIQNQSIDMKFFLSFVFLLFAIGLVAQDEPLLRFPSLSPDGQQIAFSYQGDIWTVAASGGVARRLTIHESYESLPQWSPDGKMIAFSGNRYGNDDIFVMDTQGGMPKRLTYYSGGDDAPQWMGNDEIIFSSARMFRQVERESEIYKVSVKGGTPQRMLDAFGNHPVPSNDGRFVAYVTGSCRFVREAYDGPANRDIWVYDTQTKNYTALAAMDAQESHPAWGAGQEIFYLSAANGRYNVYRKGGVLTKDLPQPVTNFKDEGIRYFDVSADGKQLVFERSNGIFLQPTDGSKKAQRVNIQVTSDYRFDPVQQEKMTKGASDLAVSPNGKYLLFSVRGEIFVRVNDKDKDGIAQLTHHPYRDQEAQWLNDSTVVFISDRDGNKELYTVQSSDQNQTDLYRTLKRSTKRMTDTPVDEANFTLSPDRTKVAINRGRGQLIVADISADGLSNEKILLDGWATASGVRWSPDGQWLAYSLPDLDFNSEIYIHAADGSKEPVNVSMHPRSDNSPFWSADGSKLGFLSIRNNGDSDVWFAWLRDADWQQTKQDWEWDEDEEEDEIAADSITVIDLEGIHERLVQVTRLPGNEGDLAISTDGETFFFTTNNSSRSGSPGDGGLYSIKWDGSEQKELLEKTSIYNLIVADDGKKLYFLKRGGTIASMKIDDKKADNLGFSATMKIDHEQERLQVFNEAWKGLRDGFYDPNFHGQDWNKLRAQYEPLALSASTEQDFRDMFNTMLGQLNASHMGLYGSNPEETQSDRSGMLGVEVAPATNGVKVTRVVMDSPADRERSQLTVGDNIVAVNGTPINSSTNMYQLLQGTASERTLLDVIDAQGTSREVVIRPSSSLRTELYEEWVAERKRLTEEYSGGRLGYIHIQGMNWTSFERFERELTASGLGKEGIVIDVRYNGGGWTTDMLMTVLNVRQHSYTVPRGAVDKLEGNHPKYADHYPYGERLPQAALTKPSIALCNQTSYSNAEIFSHAFKTLNHGTLVGMPTFGAVISTGGMGLLNGGLVRMPFRAWYVKATGENMELGPAVPDVEVENSQNSKAAGRDEQLQKAVEILLSELE